MDAWRFRSVREVLHYLHDKYNLIEGSRMQGSSSWEDNAWQTINFTSINVMWTRLFAEKLQMGNPQNWQGVTTGPSETLEGIVFKKKKFISKFWRNVTQNIGKINLSCVYVLLLVEGVLFLWVEAPPSSPVSFFVLSSSSPLSHLPAACPPPSCPLFNLITD